jgi:hypothetical protein
MIEMTEWAGHQSSRLYSQLLGGKEQEDHSSKQAQANSSRDPISKKPNIKKDWQSDSSGRVPA